MAFEKDSLRQQAADLAFRHALGLVTVEEVIAWADRLVSSQDSPGTEIIDLSLAANDPASIHRRLDELGNGSDRRMALKRALLEMHNRVADGRADLRSALNSLLDSYCRKIHAIPESVHALVVRSHAQYDLFDAGIRARSIGEIEAKSLAELRELAEHL
jgi:hypothetical protein